MANPMTLIERVARAIVALIFTAALLSIVMAACVIGLFWMFSTIGPLTIVVVPIGFVAICAAVGAFFGIGRNRPQQRNNQGAKGSSQR